MSSPQRVQIELQHQIKRRINHDSPTKYDIDFYLRKITRLQNDFNNVQDELSKARVRLRRAQDFEIKYDLILKQNSMLQSDIEKYEKDLCEYKSVNEQMKARLQEKSTKNEDWSHEKKRLMEEVQRWKNKFQQSEDKRTTTLLEHKEKSDNVVKKEIDIMKRDFGEKEEDYQFQIRQLKKTLHQKQTVENVVGMRVQKIRKQKDQEIKRLGNVIEKLKEDHLGVIKEKNEEFDKLREKFEKMFNFELQNLKKNLDDQDQLFSIQINGLRQMIGLKNQQISKLLAEMKKQSEQHEKDRQQLIAEINILKEKIYTIERQNQIELYNLKERLTKIHSLDIEAVQKRYSQLIDTLKKDRNELENLLKQKDKIVEAQKKQLERVKGQFLDRIKQRENRIKQLTERLKQTGEMNASQLKTLHQSFHKIESEKELMSNEYQANVGFLNQQIAKLTTSNQVKNNEIKNLHEQLASLKRNFAQSIRDLQNKWRQDRKQRQAQRQKDRENKEKLQDQYRIKERDWKNKQRLLQRQKEKQQRQKNKLKFIVQQLEKDIQRLNQYIKALDDNLKNQYKKNQNSMLDAGGIRRQLTSELQRQKAQLQAIKRMQVDQIEKKYEIQVTRLTNQNEKLQTDLLNKSLAVENLESEFKKLEHINKNIDKINKEKLLQYQKKMATLNNQINLTQNLYQSFLQAKSRNSKKAAQRQK